MLRRMSHRLAVLLLLAGCGGHAPAAPLAPTGPDPTARITATAIGPLTGATPATLVGLRAQLAGVAPVSGPIAVAVMRAVGSGPVGASGAAGA